MNDENTCIVDGRLFRAVTVSDDDGCPGCAFENSHRECGLAGDCAPYSRADRRNIIWVPDPDAVLFPNPTPCRKTLDVSTALVAVNALIDNARLLRDVLEDYREAQ